MRTSVPQHRRPKERRIGWDLAEPLGRVLKTISQVRSCIHHDYTEKYRSALAWSIISEGSEHRGMHANRGWPLALVALGLALNDKERGHDCGSAHVRASQMPLNSNASSRLRARARMPQCIFAMVNSQSENDDPCSPGLQRR